jgi:RND family efflux transporter MFP subunit
MRSAAAVFLCVLCTSCTREETHATATQEAPAVAVAKVGPADLSQNLVLTGEFKPFQEVDVMAKVAGYVKQISVDVGDHVRQGELLAVLEIPEMADDLQRAGASIEQAQAEVARAKDELQRAEFAHQITHLSFQRLSSVLQKRPGLIAQQEIDDAQSKDLVAEAQVASARSTLTVTSQQVYVRTADRQKVKTLMEYTRVTAPFAGVVTRRYADMGSMIQAGTASHTQAMPVVRISQNSILRLILPVPESSVPTVRLNQEVKVRVPTLNRTLTGRVARFTRNVLPATRTMDTEVDVPNPDLFLTPGMYAEVDVTLNRRRSVLAAPLIAVDAQHEVMVVTPNNHVEIRKVETGMETADKVEVRSGLNEGDLVIVAGRASLQRGDEVRPKLVAQPGAKD